MLEPSSLNERISNCNHDFSVKRVLVNYVASRSHVLALAQACSRLKILDDLVFIEDLLPGALDRFHLSRNNFSHSSLTMTRGQLVGLHVATTSHLVHFTADSRIVQPASVDWIKSGTDLMAADRRILSCTPSWELARNDRVVGNAGAREEAIWQTGEWMVGRGFSDNCYLVEVNRMREVDLNQEHEDSDRYPKYAGNSFERRVNSFMMVGGFFRACHKSVFYRHELGSKRGTLSRLGRVGSAFRRRRNS